MRHTPPTASPRPSQASTAGLSTRPQPSQASGAGLSARPCPHRPPEKTSAAVLGPHRPPEQASAPGLSPHRLQASPLQDNRPNSPELPQHLQPQDRRSQARPPPPLPAAPRPSRALRSPTPTAGLLIASGIPRDLGWGCRQVKTRRGGMGFACCCSLRASSLGAGRQPGPAAGACWLGPGSSRGGGSPGSWAGG